MLHCRRPREKCPIFAILHASARSFYHDFKGDLYENRSVQAPDGIPFVHAHAFCYRCMHAGRCFTEGNRARESGAAIPRKRYDEDPFCEVANGSYQDIDRGVEPHFYLTKLSSFFDREALTAYINSLK